MAYVKKEYVEPAAYKSAYSDTINNLVSKAANGEKFNYDPTTDLAYQSYAKEYGRLGQQANENTMANAAINTGGLVNSYAVSAAAQAQNDYAQQLTAKIPELERAAYERYNADRSFNIEALNSMQALEQQNYAQYSDQRNYDRNNYEYDNNFDYGQYKDQQNYDYQVGRDAVSDAQWDKSYALDKQAAALNEEQYKADISNTSISQFATSITGRYTTVAGYDKLIASLKKNKPTGWKQKVALAEQARSTLKTAQAAAKAKASKSSKKSSATSSSRKGSSSKSSSGSGSSSNSDKSKSSSKGTTIKATPATLYTHGTNIINSLTGKPEVKTTSSKKMSKKEQNAKSTQNAASEYSHEVKTAQKKLRNKK